ncbi:MAG: zinc ribbon domain-containing protein [Roseiflexus sp.]|nr:zinc ribbon domain-containing protein [Roseiflexus sp.]MCS7289186.1 zinc ribbon domain-containing protein [Roseiflexus sp.]MDW8144771.1 zinc ribbon domain-containing protein [Roseiflexaceae bacterium]MDW8232187.1 zinc ribbon domain-containing protein [Roseiflexaceae bacterium]
MPLYEYQCGECAHTFDALRPLHRIDEPVNCPACGSRQVRRKMPVIALRMDPTSTRSGSACCSGRCSCASHGRQG